MAPQRNAIRLYYAAIIIPMRYAFDRFVLETDEFRLTRDGEVIALSPKPFDLLATLVARAGQLVTRDELLRRVWPDVTVEQSSLNAAMSVLRQALGESAPALIETVPGRGYRFIGELRESNPAARVPAAALDGGLRVVVVDDHAVVRLGVRTLLGQDRGCHVVAEAGSIHDARAITIEHCPDLMILDLVIDGDTSLSHIAQFRDAAPQLRVIVLSMHSEEEWARRALAAGARGYVMKGEMLSELAAAVDTVRNGGVWVSARIGRSIVQDFLQGKALSQ